MIDNINHPDHYCKADRKECIVEMEEKFGTEAVYWFCELNAYKYEHRAGEKDGNIAVQDLKKALWYVRKAKEMQKKMEVQND